MSSEAGPKVQRALKMLRLQELDNLYASQSRPRFGKRGEREGPLVHNTPFVEIEANHFQYQSGQDESAPGWLSLRR